MRHQVPARNIFVIFPLHANSVPTTVSKKRTIWNVTAVFSLESWVTSTCVARHAHALTRALVDTCAIRDSTADSCPAWIAVALKKSYTSSAFWNKKCTILYKVNHRSLVKKKLTNMCYQIREKDAKFGINYWSNSREIHRRPGYSLFRSSPSGTCIRHSQHRPLFRSNQTHLSTWERYCSHVLVIKDKPKSNLLFQNATLPQKLQFINLLNV